MWDAALRHRNRHQTAGKKKGSVSHYKFTLQAGDASIHLGGAGGPRLRDAEWWLVNAKDDNDDDSCEEDSDSAENDSVDTSEDSDIDGGSPSAKVTFIAKQKDGTETCAVHAMNN